jgi:hypothetical protein
MGSQHFTVNQTPASYGLALYQMISTMLAAGWTMVMSSDGTTSGAGVHVTSGSSGAGGLANTGAWVVMQQPAGNVAPYAGTRQIMLQVSNTTGNAIRCVYSRAAGFTGGTATQSPTATDERFVAGGGTPASPTYYTWSNGSPPAMRFECMADDGTAGSKMPFAVYAVDFATGGGISHGGFLFDPVSNYETGDSDPYVLMWGQNGGAWVNTSDFAASSGGPVTDATKEGNSSGYAKCWNNPSALNSLPAVFYSTQGLVPAEGSTQTAVANMGTSPTTGNDINVPVIWARCGNRGGTTGWKGVSMMCRYRGANRSSGTTISVSGAGAKDFIVVADLVLPWDGSAPVV